MNLSSLPQGPRRMCDCCSQYPGQILLPNITGFICEKCLDILKTRVKSFAGNEPTAGVAWMKTHVLSLPPERRMAAVIAIIKCEAEEI